MNIQEIKEVVSNGYFGMRTEITHTQARAASKFIKNTIKEIGGDYTKRVSSDDVIYFVTECNNKSYQDILDLLEGEKGWLIQKMPKL